MFCVDLRALVGPPPDEEVLSLLAALPCPTLALHHGERPPQWQRWLDRFDVVLDDEAALGRVMDRVRRWPLASQALVQLLRQSEALPVTQAILAESWVYSTLQAGPEFSSWRAGRGAPPGLAPNSEPAVRSERFGSTLVLELNRPQKHNAFSTEIRDGLVEALRIASADPGVEAVRVCGRGPSFCSGGDLDEFGTLPDPATAHAVRSTRNAAALIHALGARVRFDVHGACIGAGVELPAFSGRVIAREGAFFELPELSLGLVPGAGGTASLPRRVGRQRTAWLALSGERIDVSTALAWGLVDEIAST